MKLSLRDLFRMILAIAIFTAWRLDHAKMSQEVGHLTKEVGRLAKELQSIPPPYRGRPIKIGRGAGTVLEFSEEAIRKAERKFLELHPIDEEH